VQFYLLISIVEHDYVDVRYADRLALTRVSDHVDSHHGSKYFSTMSKVFGLFLFLLVQLVGAQENSLVDVPDNYPVLNFSMNPIYHSIGVQLGHVLSMRRERPIFRTFEGEMMLGFGSSPGAMVDRKCVQARVQARRTSGNQQEQDEQRRVANEDCFLFDNPFRFSTLRSKTFNSVVVQKDRPIVLYYINYHIAPSFALMRTRNKVLDSFAVIPNLKIDRQFQIAAWARLHPEAGVITGRIVRASLEFSVRKTYEVIIQESQNADNFLALSVSDGRMFRYITQAMLTGKLLRVEFMRLYKPHSKLLSALFNYVTDYRIISVEILD